MYVDAGVAYDEGDGEPDFLLRSEHTKRTPKTMANHAPHPACLFFAIRGGVEGGVRGRLPLIEV